MGERLLRMEGVGSCVANIIDCSEAACAGGTPSSILSPSLCSKSSRLPMRRRSLPMPPGLPGRRLSSINTGPRRRSPDNAPTSGADCPAINLPRDRPARPLAASSVRRLALFRSAPDHPWRAKTSIWPNKGETPPPTSTLYENVGIVLRTLLRCSVDAQGIRSGGGFS